MDKEYDPSAGITLYFDFAMGISERLATDLEVRKARVIYGLYEVSMTLELRLGIILSCTLT